jgi:hypothetical protein
MLRDDASIEKPRAEERARKFSTRVLSVMEKCTAMQIAAHSKGFMTAARSVCAARERRREASSANRSEARDVPCGFIACLERCYRAHPEVFLQKKKLLLRCDFS